MRSHRSAQNSRKPGTIWFNNSQKKSKWWIKIWEDNNYQKMPIKTAMRISPFQISDKHLSYADGQELGKWEFSYYVVESTK